MKNSASKIRFPPEEPSSLADLALVAVVLVVWVIGDDIFGDGYGRLGGLICLAATLLYRVYVGDRAKSTVALLAGTVCLVLIAYLMLPSNP